MANDFCTECVGLCTGTTPLPALDVDQDCFAYDLVKSQISGLVFLPSGATGPTDWTSAMDWAAVIDNTDILDAFAKYLAVEGEMLAPEKTVIDLPKGQTRTSVRTYTITANVRNLSDTNYTFLHALQCGNPGTAVWFQTVGGRLFGGQDGIEIASADVDFIYAGGKDDVELATITITFDACGDPERTDDPIG